jgi:hypothetical protein
MKDNPQIIRYLKSIITSNTVVNNIKFSHLINKFNRVNLERIFNLRSEKGV